MSPGALEIDRDALFLPIAVARRVELFFLARRRLRGRGRIGLGDRRRLAEIVRRVEVFGPFHDVKMEAAEPHAKR